MRIALVVILIAIAFGLGWFARPQIMAVTQSGPGTESAESGESEPLYWVAPMDPNYRRDKPGQSPMGMDLVPVYEKDNTSRGDGGVQINAAVRNNLGVRTGRVTRGDVSVPVTTVGYVTDDEDQLAHVHSRIAGWVEVLHVKSVGDTVTAGEPLFDLYSPELLNAQQEFLLSQRLTNGPIASAAGGKLRAFGMTDAQIASLKKTGKVRERITVFAPSSGYVTNLPVRAGMYVRPDTEIMAIGSRDSVWVIAEFFERQAGLVKAGQSVTFLAPAAPDQRWQGVIDYVYPELDPMTRSLRARVRVPNPDQLLRPNMFVQLTMDAPIGENLLTIPRPALIQRGQSKHVLLAEGDGYFRPVPVTVGREAGDRVVVHQGLEEGQEVVTSAQFLIDSETSLEQALVRLDGGESPEAPDATEAPMMEMPLITSEGILADMAQDSSTVTLEHQPIPELDWPAMTMAFGINESVKTTELSVGQNVVFKFRETPQGYQVVELQPAPRAQSTTGE